MGDEFIIDDIKGKIEWVNKLNVRFVEEDYLT